MDTDSASTSDLINILAKVEAAADDVLVDRQQLIQLDKKRQENRMAERYLKTEAASSKKSWLCLGNTFVKLPSKTAHQLLVTNQKAIDKEINTIRDGLKEKVNKLQDLEVKAPLNRGYYLTPLSPDDARSVGSSNDF